MKRASLQLSRLNFTLVLLTFILLLTVFTATAFAETIVRVSPQEPVVEAGEDFTVNIYIEPNEPIAGIQFDFMFDNSLVSVKKVREGNLLKQAGSSTMFKPGETESSKGTITGIYGFILGKSTASVPGTFAAIDLTPAGEQGVCKLQLSNVVVSNSSGHAVPVKVVNSTVRIEKEPVLSSGVPSEITQPGEVLAEEELIEKELTEELIENEPQEGTLVEGSNEDYQEDQNNQPPSQSIFSDIYDYFRNWFLI